MARTLIMTPFYEKYYVRSPFVHPTSSKWTIKDFLKLVYEPPG